MDIRVKDLSLDMSMSTVIGLSDLAEDEIISKPLPMEVLLSNVRVNIMEDRPPVNITSPGPVPIHLQIGKMRIERDRSGTFQIQPIDAEANDNCRSNQGENLTDKRKERDRELVAIQLVMQRLKIDNDNLKIQLANTEKSNENKAYVNLNLLNVSEHFPKFSSHDKMFFLFFSGKLKQESEALKKCLKRAQDDISMLLEEKRKLLDTVRSLQVN